jgi:hypothetical protein
VKTILFFPVEFDGRHTDGESMSVAFDNVLKLGMSELDGCWDDYGCVPKYQPTACIKPDEVWDAAETLKNLIDGQDDDQAEALRPARAILLKLLGTGYVTS